MKPKSASVKSTPVRLGAAELPRLALMASRGAAMSVRAEATTASSASPRPWIILTTLSL